jgi:S1-C subfamily serine protease
MNKILTNLEKFKKAIVTIISKTDTPFISEIEEVVTTTGFLIDINKLLILTIRKAARMSPSTIKVQFYNGKIVNGKVIYSGKIYIY